MLMSEYLDRSFWQTGQQARRRKKLLRDLQSVVCDLTLQYTLYLTSSEKIDIAQPELPQ